MNVAQAYEQVNEIKPAADVAKLTLEEARAAVRKMYRHLTGDVFPYSVAETSGNRVTWLHGSEFRVNVGNGWSDLIHLFSHWYHRARFPQDRPHSKRHARIERKLRKLSMDRGWMFGALRRAEPAPATKEDERANLIDQHRSHAEKMRARWEKKLKTATRQMKKWSVKVRYYDKKSAAMPTSE